MRRTEGPYVIAEIAQAHEGSLGIAHSYIDALSGTGVDAVKFQTHIAEAESSVHEPFRVKFSYEDLTRMDYWKRMEFTAEQWAGLKAHCEEKELEFLSSPFSNAAVDLLEKIEVKKYKVGSGEVNNFLLLEHIASTGKEIILSSGMSSFDELDKAVDFIKRKGNKLSLLQCTTAYPTVPEQWGLNVMQELSKRYNLPTGFSDHSGHIFACLAATALGADILEFHVVFDQKMFGPDAKASIPVEQVKKLVQGIRAISTALHNPVIKSDNSDFISVKKIFEKSLAVNKDLAAGHVLTFHDLESKKPAGYGISASEFEHVIGRELRTPLQKWDFITVDNLV